MEVNKFACIRLILEVKFGDDPLQTSEKFTAQRMKFSIKDFFSKYDQIHRNPQKTLLIVCYSIRGGSKERNRILVKMSSKNCWSKDCL